MEKQAALDLLEFIHESPTNFHAVLSIKQRLQAHGFKQLFSGEAWHIEHGGKYFEWKCRFFCGLKKNGFVLVVLLCLMY